MKGLLWEALGTGLVQGRQGGVAPGVPARSAPWPPGSARQSVLFPFLSRFFFFTFLLLVLFSRSFTFPTQALVSSWPPDERLLFVLRPPYFCGICCPPVHAHPFLLSVAAPQHTLSSVQAPLFSACPVLPCAFEPAKHLPACPSSPLHVVLVSTFASPSLFAEAVFSGLLYFCSSALVFYME